MAMEHRCGTRTSLGIGIIINRPRLGRVPARARNISLGGMYVETDVPLAVNQTVTVEFTFPHIGPVHRWPATVVHTSSDGVGLMFDSFRTDELATLLELLQAAEERNRAAMRSATPAVRHSQDRPQARMRRRVAAPTTDAHTDMSRQLKLGGRT